MSRWRLQVLAAVGLLCLTAPAADARHHKRAVDASDPAPAATGGDTCRTGLSGGSPQVELRHIFCGEVNRRGMAVGFHSRPGGVNPGTVSGTGEARPVRGYPGLYNLTRFQITQNGETQTKGISTLYPDKCSVNDVIAAIQYAFNNGQKSGPKFTGPSGPSCTTDDGKPFPITGFTGGRDGDRIRTGYPDVRGQ